MSASLTTLPVGVCAIISSFLPINDVNCTLPLVSKECKNLFTVTPMTSRKFLFRDPVPAHAFIWWLCNHTDTQQNVRLLWSFGKRRRLMYELLQAVIEGGPKESFLFALSDMYNFLDPEFTLIAARYGKRTRLFNQATKQQTII